MARKAPKTLDVQPSDEGEQIKPSELIDVHLPTTLTRQDRVRWNLLLANAWDRLDEPEADHTIRTSELKLGGHYGTDRIEDSLVRLMQAVITVQATGRKGQPVTRMTTLLGGCDVEDDDRPAGEITYSFDKRLIWIIKFSTAWGKLRKELMCSLSSKYAIALYEMAEKRVRLKYKNSEEFKLNEFRGLLSVPTGKLKRWADLRRYAIEPAVEEINQLCDFSISVEPIKEGRSVAAVRLSWSAKDDEAHDEAARERQRPRVGRKARRKGTTEEVADTAPPPPDARALAKAWWESLPYDRRGPLTRSYDPKGELSRDEVIVRVWQAEGQPKPADT